MGALQFSPAWKHADEGSYQVWMVYTRLGKLVWISCLWDSGGNYDVLCDGVVQVTMNFCWVLSYL